MKIKSTHCNFDLDVSKYALLAGSQYFRHLFSQNIFQNEITIFDNLPYDQNTLKQFFNLFEKSIKDDSDILLYPSYSELTLTHFLELRKFFQIECFQNRIFFFSACTETHLLFY